MYLVKMICESIELQPLSDQKQWQLRRPLLHNIVLKHRNGERESGKQLSFPGKLTQFLWGFPKPGHPVQHWLTLRKPDTTGFSDAAHTTLSSKIRPSFVYHQIFQSITHPFRIFFWPWDRGGEKKNSGDSISTVSPVLSTEKIELVVEGRGGRAAGGLMIFSSLYAHPCKLSCFSLFVLPITENILVRYSKECNVASSYL